MALGPASQPGAAWLQGQFPELSNIAPLTKGGQKLVYTADHRVDGNVVLKLLVNCAPEEVRREILAVSEVGSPRVPRIHDSGVITTQLGDCLWLREQFVPGPTLRQLLLNAVLAPADLLRLGANLLDTLVLAEQAAIVHRDVKPENVIRDPQGAFWLLDFGLARHLTLDSQTGTALPFGKVTWGYSPPEQCRNIKPAIDARADLFALGVTLFEAATATNPFRHGAANELEMLRRVEKEPLPRLMLPTLRDPKGFADFIAAMTQKRRDHRPRTAREALTWMEEICRDEGV